MNIAGGNATHYENLGYEIPRYIDKRGRLKIKNGTRIMVSVMALPRGSNVEVTKICDICSIHIPNQLFNVVMRCRKNNKDRCEPCSKLVDRQNPKLPPKEKSLWSTHPEIASLMANKEDGYKFTFGSGKKVDFKCRECGFIVHNKQINTVLRRGLSCPKCSDGFSYPEKFVYCVLQQLSIGFEIQKVFNWSKNKRYDFYIPSLKCIIETHGEQHYKEVASSKWDDLQKTKENDEIKKSLSLNNNIKHYIIIDCRRSELQFIKKNLLLSEFSRLLNLTKIDWKQCHEFSSVPIIKQACQLWNEGMRNSTKIGEVLKVARNTARSYLKQGADLGLCDYSPEISIKELKYFRGKSSGKCVVQLDGERKFIKEWDSMREASRQTGTCESSISNVCTGKRKKAGGFLWLYKEDFIKGKGGK